MVQHSDYNNQRSQECNIRIKNNNNRNSNSSSKGGSLAPRNLQITPNGQHYESTSFPLNSGSNNNNNINKAQHGQTVGDGRSCCGCSCGINKNFKDTVKGEENEEAATMYSPTISFSSSSTSSISHGRHLPHRKSNKNSLDAADYSFFSSSQASFFSRFGSSIYSANSFLWSWFTDHKETQNSNYGHLNKPPQFQNQQHQGFTSSSPLMQKSNSNDGGKDYSKQEPMLSYPCFSMFPLSSSSSTHQDPLSNTFISSSSSSLSPQSSLIHCRSKDNRNSNDFNANQNESDSSGGISTTSAASYSDKSSSSIKKLSSISKKTRKRSSSNTRGTLNAFEGGSRSIKNNQFLAATSYFPQSFLFLMCVFIFWNSLYCDFVFDDVTAIKENKDLRPHIPIKNLFYNDFWGTPMIKEQSHKSYRPLTVLTFRINYLIGGLSPLGYHLVNIILHGLVTILYFQYLKCVTSEVISLFASLMFALHPVSTIYSFVNNFKTMRFILKLSLN